MIPEFVAKLGAACSAPLDHAATGCVASVTLTA